MSAACTIVVWVPAAAGMSEVDVLGRRALDHLIESVAGIEDAQTGIVVAGGAAVTSGSPAVRVRSAAELAGLGAAGGVVALLDARCWFSRAALQALIARAADAANGIRVVSSRGGSAAGERRADTLAIGLAPGAAKAGLFRPDRIGAATELTQLLDPAIVRDLVVCEAASLHSASAPFEVAGYEDIAELERRLLAERAARAMGQGVRLRDPRTVYIRGELACGADVEIDANVILEGRVVLGDGARIGANSIVRNATIGARTRVNPFSIVEDSELGCDGFVGPYGRVRPGNRIGDAVQIGNYVEIKNSRIGSGSRINHHSFIGDAVLGERVTIGAGTITCNYDGVGTNQTIIERDAAIGSGCNLVAPVRIGEGATVGAGSTISRNVPPGKLTLTRSPQTTIEDWRGPRTRRTGE